MKYYKKNDQNELVEIPENEVNAAKENEKNNAPLSETIEEVVDLGGTSFQRQETREIPNPEYKSSLQAYEKARVYEIPELSDMKANILTKINNSKSERNDAKNELKSALAQTKSSEEFYHAFIANYEKLLKSWWAQPSFFGSGSKLAKEMRDFAKGNFFITLNEKLDQNNKATFTVLKKDKQLFELATNKDTNSMKKTSLK